MFIFVYILFNIGDGTLLSSQVFESSIDELLVFELNNTVLSWYSISYNGLKKVENLDEEKYSRQFQTRALSLVNPRILANILFNQNIKIVLGILSDLTPYYPGTRFEELRILLVNGLKRYFFTDVHNNDKSDNPNRSELVIKFTTEFNFRMLELIRTK